MNLANHQRFAKLNHPQLITFWQVYSFAKPFWPNVYPSTFAKHYRCQPPHYMVLYTNIQFLMCTWFVNCQHKYSVSITWSHLVTLHVFCLASHHQESWPSMLWSLCHNQLIEFPVIVPTVMWCVIMIISLYIIIMLNFMAILRLNLTSLHNTLMLLTMRKL